MLMSRRDTRGYDPIVNRSASRALGLLGFAALLSQAGHLAVYQIQFGSAAQAVQSAGAHAYFPTFAKIGLGVAASALVGALLVIGAARLLAGRATATPAGGPSYITLLALLFSVQMACFAMQETIESLAAGVAVASAPHLLLVGTVGQLPVAVLGALALKWLLARFEAALLTLRAVIAASPIAGTTPGVLLLPRRMRLQPALVEACRAAYIKRGPPPPLRS